MKKRMLSIFLFVAMLTSLASCGGSEESINDTTADAIETTPAETEYRSSYGDRLPERMDLGGYEFRTLIFEDGNNMNKWSAWVDIDEQNGELLNDAAYLRNLEVEERLNVKISVIEQGGFGKTVPIVQNSVMAGDNAFDFVILQNDGIAISSLLQEGYLVDLNSVDAIDLSQPYYLQSVRETFNLNGKQFLLSGDGLCSLYSHSYIFTNMDMWNENRLEDPYALVREGKWTFDKCFSIVKDTYRDLNGNGERDTDDFYGISGIPITLTYCFHAGGGKLYEADESDYSFPVASERNIAIIEKLVKQLENPDHCYTYDKKKYTDPYFAGKTIMLFSGSSVTTLRDTEFYAGILPFPKLDEEQESYHSILAGALGAVPITVPDEEIVGTILEAYFSASSRLLKPAFIQMYVEQKVLQDDGSQEMFNLIMETGRHNFVEYVDPARMFNGYTIVSDLVTAGSTDLASRWAAIKEAAEASFADFFASME